MGQSDGMVPETASYANGNVRYRNAHLRGEMNGRWVFIRAAGSMLRSGIIERGRQAGT
ncbi:MAG: hypothetical protein R6W93_15470 [Candidatus Limnocylindrales bacterium]